MIVKLKKTIVVVVVSLDKSRMALRSLGWREESTIVVVSFPVGKENLYREAQAMVHVAVEIDIRADILDMAEELVLAVCSIRMAASALAVAPDLESFRTIE